MRKRLLILVATLALACSFAPSVALAEGDAAGAPVVIEIGADGAPIGTAGDGWTYASDVLTLEAGHAFTLTGPAYKGFVQNGGTVAGGVFDGAVNDSVDNFGTITGGTFNVAVNNSGIIGGDSVFNEYVQNGYPRFDPDKNRSCIIAGGTFNSDEIDNFGTIEGGTFNGEILSRGIIAGGTFSSTSSIASNDEDTTTGGGTISGGAFAGSVTNGDPDPDWNAATITGGTFTGTVTNYDTITGGFFALPVIDEGGTMSAATFPVSATLTGLSIAEAEDTELVVAYKKDSDERNRLTILADKGFTLPDTITVRSGAADGPELAVGADYTYDAVTGIIEIKKGSVTAPLFLAAKGTPVPAPDPDPDPDNPKPLPTPADTEAPKAATLAATGDSALPQIVLGIAALLAGSALIACTIVRRKRRAGRL